MNITYQSTNFNEKDVVVSYARIESGSFIRVFDVNDENYTTREYLIDMNVALDFMRINQHLIKDNQFLSGHQVNVNTIY